MAKVKSSYMRAALSEADFKGSLYDAIASEGIGKLQASTIIDKTNRQQQLIELAAEGVRTAEAIQEERISRQEERAGAESMSEKLDMAYEYEKPTFMDWIKGDVDFKDIGKAKYTFGDTEYTPADMIAFSKKIKDDKYKNMITKSINPKAKGLTRYEGEGMTLEKAWKSATKSGMGGFIFGDSYYELGEGATIFSGDTQLNIKGMGSVYDD